MLLWSIVRDRLSDDVALATVAVFLFSPFALLWSRTSMIEYAATAFAVGAVWAGFRWDRTGWFGWLAIACGLAVVGSLVKLTTAVVWLVPLVAFVRRPSLGVPVLGAIPLLAGVGWTRYADSIKETGVLTSIFTSDRLVEWTFGTLGERASLETWGALLFNLIPLGLLGFIWVVLLPRDKRHRRVWGFFASVVLVAAALFPTLYARHSYYAAAISPAIAALLGAGFMAALAVRPRRYVVGVTALLLAITFAIRADVWTVAFRPADPDRELDAAADIRSRTSATDLVLITGRDYSPAILFYADRRGIMMPIWADRVIIPPSFTIGYEAFDCSPSLDGRCERTP